MYKTTVDAQYWTKTGNDAGKIPANTIIETSGKTMVIRERLCWEIASAVYNNNPVTSYVGKFIEPKYLTEYIQEPPPIDPPSGVTIPETLEARDVHLVALDADGNLIGEYKSVGTIYLRRVVE